MTRIKLHTVGQLAEKSGVSVRTLHHYDEVGLLTPAIRQGRGRRLYDRDNALRLQQILTWRVLGLSLDQIKKLLDDPTFDRRTALLNQREAVAVQIARSEKLIRGIDAALDAIDEKAKRKMDLKTLFGGFDPADFADEAQQSWGETNAWKQSQERTASYSEADWRRYHADHQALCAQFASLANEGAEPDSTRAAALARRYAALIDTWFYTCDASHLPGLADMYAADTRFRDSFDAYGAGTADFVIASFRAATVY